MVTKARNDYNKYIWFCTPEQAEGKISYETIRSMDLDLCNGMAYSGSFFWLFLTPGNEIGYTIVMQYLLLPVLTVLVSYKLADRGASWKIAVLFGILYMASGYLTFDLANTIETGNVSIPSFYSLFLGILFSLIGLWLANRQIG